MISKFNRRQRRFILARANGSIVNSDVIHRVTRALAKRFRERVDPAAVEAVLKGKSGHRNSYGGPPRCKRRDLRHIPR